VRTQSRSVLRAPRRPTRSEEQGQSCRFTGRQKSTLRPEAVVTRERPSVDPPNSRVGPQGAVQKPEITPAPASNGDRSEHSEREAVNEVSGDHVLFRRQRYAHRSTQRRQAWLKGSRNPSRRLDLNATRQKKRSEEMFTGRNALLTLATRNRRGMEQGKSALSLHAR
jgi:hypothetical protein